MAENAIGFVYLFYDPLERPKTCNMERATLNQQMVTMLHKNIFPIYV